MIFIFEKSQQCNVCRYSLRKFCSVVSRAPRAVVYMIGYWLSECIYLIASNIRP